MPGGRAPPQPSLPERRSLIDASFQNAADDQEETDRYWKAIVGNGEAGSECGWCRDRWGISWQAPPRTLIEAMAAGDDEAKRAFAAMMTMRSSTSR